MKLHLDRAAFRALIENIHNVTGYRMDVIEKDYYVVLLLQELSSKQDNGLLAYFKGGTALYKALKTTKRFSEDIDLSVDTRNCGNAQNNKRLENATKKYTSLERDRAIGFTNRSEVMTGYRYNPVVEYDSNDALQRFGQVKIEATSFTISEPVTVMEIAPILYENATDQQKAILSEQYDVYPFQIKTISIERIFIDKLFASEAYVRRSNDAHRAFEAAKHIYDLAVMKDEPSIIRLLSDGSQLQNLLDIRVAEELERRDGIPGIYPNEFILFQCAEQDKKVESAYDVMQNQYVFKAEDRISYFDANKAVKAIGDKLTSEKAWIQYKPTSVDVKLKIAKIRNSEQTSDNRSVIRNKTDIVQE